MAHGTNFEGMSNDELIDYIGENIDPDTSRSELLLIAREVEADRLADTL